MKPRSMFSGSKRIGSIAYLLATMATTSPYRYIKEMNAIFGILVTAHVREKPCEAMANMLPLIRPKIIEFVTKSVLILTPRNINL